MNAYETQRLENIRRNKALIKDLGIQSQAQETRPRASRPPPSKRRKLDINSQPTRTSARIASIPSQPVYQDKEDVDERVTARKPGRTKPQKPSTTPPTETRPAADIAALRSGWTSWTPTAPAPTREPVTGVFRFASHPIFTPNKSPEEMLREGCFGGSYFRPLRSRRLGITVQDDWRELPDSWIQGLSVERYLANPEYDPEVNKYKVACGQSIEEWEAAGWIDHNHDVRGWFQWYCRFFQGRRCDDDDRQVGRWNRCVGEKGRWRRTLLKKYKALGITQVWADDEDDEAGDVSPVVHQTCHHWAFEVKQGVLDEYWRTGA